MLEKRQSSGVSPVIGIILMVAVTVGLVALASTIVFDLGSNVNEPADVSANLQYDSESTEVIAEVVRNENADKVFVRFNKNDFNSSSYTLDTDGMGGGGSEDNIVTTSGKTGTQVLGVEDMSVSGTVELVATVGETGNEQVVRTVEYDNT